MFQKKHKTVIMAPSEMYLEKQQTQPATNELTEDHNEPRVGSMCRSQISLNSVNLDTQEPTEDMKPDCSNYNSVKMMEMIQQVSQRQQEQTSYFI